MASGEEQRRERRLQKMISGEMRENPAERTVRSGANRWRHEGEDEELLRGVDDARGGDCQRCSFEEDGRVVPEVL